MTSPCVAFRGWFVFVGCVFKIQFPFAMYLRYPCFISAILLEVPLISLLSRSDHLIYASGGAKEAGVVTERV